MNIKSYKFDESIIEELRGEWFTPDSHVVYILENGQEMYIGESNEVLVRFKRHLRNPERRKLDKAHIIVDPSFNKSAIQDIESQLIQYVAVDGKFKLQNRDGGHSNKSYKDRYKYITKFELAWQELQQMDLAQGDLKSLRNSATWKYSPYKPLTEKQENIANDIKRSTRKNESKSYLIHGGAGTGKTVLAINLVESLKQDDKTKHLRIALVIPQDSFRATVKKAFSGVKGLNPGVVVGPHDVVGKDYDLLIVDEVHRLKRRVNLRDYPKFDKANEFYGLGNDGTQLGWIRQASKSQVLFYDAGQSVQPGDIRPGELSDLNVIERTLTSQLRVLGGEDYIKFINALLSGKAAKNNIDPNAYELSYFSSVSDLIQAIKERDRTHSGESRVIAGFGWEWKTNKDKSLNVDFEINRTSFKWNSVREDWPHSKNAIDEVGCIHTIQSQDLTYAGVIIGPELSYDPNTEAFVINRDAYHDLNGKRSVESPEELKGYILNIYKVLLTRGIHGTYIHAVDKELERYLQQYIENDIRDYSRASRPAALVAHIA